MCLVWISLITLSLLVTVLIGTWFFVTQPLFPKLWSTPGDVIVDASRLEAHVRMLSETLAPRSAANPENLDRAAAYIRGHLTQAGGETSEQVYVARGKSYRNVISGFGAKTRERLVIGAHYDAAESTPGADDNASGVAGLLELARSLSATALPLRVELVAYTLEEPPHFGTRRMGSYVHAAALKKQGIPVRLMISLEMLGYYSDTEGSQQYPLEFLHLFYPTRGNFIAVVGNAQGAWITRRVKRALHTAADLPVRSINAPEALLPGINFSDHFNYWDRGYPALMITDTAFLRNPHYHLEGDRADTLDYSRMVEVVRGLHAAVIELAQ